MMLLFVWNARFLCLFVYLGGGSEKVWSRFAFRLRLILKSSLHETCNPSLFDARPKAKSLKMFYSWIGVWEGSKNEVKLGERDDCFLLLQSKTNFIAFFFLFFMSKPQLQTPFNHFCLFKYGLQVLCKGRALFLSR